MSNQSSSGSTRTLTELDVEDEQLTDWRMLIDRLHASFDTGDFATAVEFVEAISLAAQDIGHHLDLDLTYGRFHGRVAPAFWVLADPQGNRACLTTWQGRD